MTNYSNYTIRALESHETIAVRQLVLRPNQPIEACHFVGDEAADTFHFGAVTSAGEVIGVSTVLCCHESRYQQFSSQRQLQLRAMAVLPDFQRQGTGKALLNVCLKEAAKRDCKTLWCNARSSAVDFYLKGGLSIVNEDAFEIEGVGPHHVMFKHLDD